MNRNIENRSEKKPILSDLRESGCVAGTTQMYDFKKSYLLAGQAINNIEFNNVNNTKAAQKMLICGDFTK